MRKVSYTFMIPDDTDVESVIINLKHKAKTNEQYKRGQEKRIVTTDHPRYNEYDEADEGLLYDELY